MVYAPKLKRNVLVTGGSSRFCKFLRLNNSNLNFIYTDKKNFNILNYKQMNKFLKK